MPKLRGGRRSDPPRYPVTGALPIFSISDYCHPSDFWAEGPIITSSLAEYKYSDMPLFRMTSICLLCALLIRILYLRSSGSIRRRRFPHHWHLRLCRPHFPAGATSDRCIPDIYVSFLQDGGAGSVRQFLHPPSTSYLTASAFLSWVVSHHLLRISERRPQQIFVGSIVLLPQLLHGSQIGGFLSRWNSARPRGGRLLTKSLYSSQVFALWIRLPPGLHRPPGRCYGWGSLVADIRPLALSPCFRRLGKNIERRRLSARLYLAVIALAFGCTQSVIFHSSAEPAPFILAVNIFEAQIYALISCQILVTVIPASTIAASPAYNGVIHLRELDPCLILLWHPDLGLLCFNKFISAVLENSKQHDAVCEGLAYRLGRNVIVAPIVPTKAGQAVAFARSNKRFRRQSMRPSTGSVNDSKNPEPGITIPASTNVLLYMAVDGPTHLMSELQRPAPMRLNLCFQDWNRKIVSTT